MYCEICGKHIINECVCFDDDPKKKLMECIRIAEKEFEVIKRIAKGENFRLKFGQTVVPFSRVEYIGHNLLLSVVVPLPQEKRWKLFYKKEYFRFAFIDSDGKEIFWRTLGYHRSSRYDSISFTWHLGFGEGL